MPDAVWTDLRPTPQTSATGSSSPQASLPNPSSALPLVEAQGWIIGDDGTVILAAQALPATPQYLLQHPADCPSVPNPTILPSLKYPRSSPQ